jgi:hypothetical protein
MKSSMKKIICVPVALGIMCSSAMALQVNWSMSQAAATYSDGAIIPTGGLTFAIGTFTAGFDPGSAAPEDVVPNWIDAGLAGNTSPWNNLANATFPAFGRIGTGTAATVVRPDGPVGLQGYIFGFSSLDLGTVPEWILLTNPAWTFPAGTPAGEVALPGAEWSAINPGTQMLVGNSFNLADGGAALDRAFQTQAIPEPSTYALIFGLGILGFLGFRRFRK